MCKTVKFLTWGALLFTALYFGGHFAYWFFVDATVPGTVRRITEQERQEHRRLMEKHGDYSLTCDHNGQNCFFIRNGQKCRWM